MKIPQTVKVMGHEYQVVHSTKLQLEGSSPGTACPNTLTIELSSIAPESRKSEALLHEIFEALDYHLETKLEHNQLSALSEGLFQVLRDNDDLNFADRSAA